MGDVGARVGIDMKGGTIIVGHLGPEAGTLMRRGTLAAGSAEALLPTFVDAGRYQGTFVSLLQRYIKADAPEALSLVSDVFQHYSGDMADLGKGELLLKL